VFKDAAVDAPHICTIMDSLGALTFGTMAAPRDSAPGATTGYFEKLDDGPDMGKLNFFIALRLNNDMPAFDAIIIDVVEPWATNTPYAFETDATTTGAVKADALLFGDLDTSAMTVQQLYWAKSGAITFSKFEQPLAIGSDIFGNVTQTMFKEIDQMSGEDVAGGCSTTMTSFNFFLNQDKAPPMTTLQRGTFGDNDPALMSAIERYKDIKIKRIANGAM
jgi:hypothetical protein